MKLNCDESPSNFAFKFKLRRYTADLITPTEIGQFFARFGRVHMVVLGTDVGGVIGRGAHSSTLRLNLSAFCGIGGTFRGCLGGV